MEKKIMYILSGIGIVIVLVGLLIANDFMLLPSRGNLDGTSEGFATEDEGSAAMSLVSETKITELVNDYYASLAEAAPPESDQSAAQAAYNLLAAEAKALKEEDMSLSGFLVYFSGGQDIPDEGFEVGKVTVGPDDTYEVSTTWKYSGDNIEKTVYVVKENGNYLIMAIQ